MDASERARGTGFSEAGKEMREHRSSSLPIRPSRDNINHEELFMSRRGASVEEEVEEEEEEDEEESEESRPMIKCRDPGCPTEEEREAHEFNHLPFRS